MSSKEKEEKKKSSSSKKTDEEKKSSKKEGSSSKKDGEHKSKSSSKDKESSKKDKGDKEKSSKDKESSKKDRGDKEKSSKSEKKEGSGDEWKEKAEKNKAKVEELTKEIEELRKQNEEAKNEAAKAKAEAEAAKAEAEAAKAGASSGQQGSDANNNDSGSPTDPKTGKVVTIKGEWKGLSAGGSMNNLSWRYNPQIFIRPSRSTPCTIKLSQPAGSSTGIGWYLFESPVSELRRLLIASDEDVLLKSPFAKAETVEKAFSMKKTKNPYILIPCTLDPEEELEFTVTIEAEAPVTAQLISKDQEWPQPTILGNWTSETAGGNHTFDSFPKNPQYLMKVEQQSQIQILLLQEKFEEFENVTFYVIETEPERTQKITEKNVAKDKNKLIVPPKFEDPQTCSASFNCKPGTYCIIPATFNPGNEAPFKLLIMCENLMPSIKELADAACLSVNGNWQGETAGGCLNDVRSWRGNVQYELRVKKDADVTIRVKQTSAAGGTGDLASIGFYILTGGKRVVRPKKKNIYFKSKFAKKSDGVSAKLRIPASEESYVIVPCTFNPGQEGAYSIQIYSDDPTFTEYVELNPLPIEKDLERFQGKGEWDGPTAGGCLNYVTWRNNPQFLLEIGKTCEVTIFLNTKDDGMKPGFYVVNAPNTTNIRVNLKNDEVLVKAAFREGTEVVKTHKFEPGRYNIIPCTYEIGMEGKFDVTVYASEFGVCELKPIPAAILTLRGEWTKENAGGCINDMKSWLSNPHYYIAIKQAVELAAVVIQSPGEDVPLEDLHDIGFYITNSDGDGNPKTNEEKDLIAKTNFSPDKDIATVVTIPACHWPYVITPCTFKPGITGKFEVQLLMDKQSLEYVEFSKEPMAINPAEVVGAGEDPQLREVRRRFKTLASRTVELVELTETGKEIPEFMKYVGRTLLSTVANFQDSIVAWADGVEPGWWTEGYDEEYTEEYPEETDKASAPPAAPNAPPPPPSAPKPPPGPAINFSKPVKSVMVEAGRASAMTKEMIDQLESKPKSFMDELLVNITSGMKNLKKVEIPPKPVVEDPLVCAFNLEILNKRRAAIEGLQDKDNDGWSDDDWDENED